MLIESHRIIALQHLAERYNVQLNMEIYNSVNDIIDVLNNVILQQLPVIPLYISDGKFMNSEMVNDLYNLLTHDGDTGIWYSFERSKFIGHEVGYSVSINNVINTKFAFKFAGIIDDRSGEIMDEYAVVGDTLINYNFGFVAPNKEI